MRLEEFLGSAGIEDKAIRMIMEFLEWDAEALDGGHPDEVTGDEFGGSETGATLGTHSSLAQQHVVAALQELSEGLRAYRTNVHKWRSDVAFTDEEQAALLNGIRAASERTTARTFHRRPPATPVEVPAEPTVAATEGGES